MRNISNFKDYVDFHQKYLAKEVNNFNSEWMCTYKSIRRKRFIRKDWKYNFSIDMKIWNDKKTIKYKIWLVLFSIENYFHRLRENL